MNLQHDCAFRFSLIRLSETLRRGGRGFKLTRSASDAMEVCHECIHPICPGIGQIVSDALLQCGGQLPATEIPPVFEWTPDLAPYQLVATSHAIYIDAPIVVNHPAVDVVP